MKLPVTDVKVANRKLGRGNSPTDGVCGCGAGGNDRSGGVSSQESTYPTPIEGCANATNTPAPWGVESILKAHPKSAGCAFFCRPRRTVTARLLPAPGSRAHAHIQNTRVYQHAPSASWQPEVLPECTRQIAHLPLWLAVNPHRVVVTLDPFDHHQLVNRPERRANVEVSVSIETIHQ